MEKSEIIKNSLDKKHDQFLEEYRNFFYLLIGLVIAYVTSNIYQLGSDFQAAFFLGIFLVGYALYIIRKRLDEIQKDIARIKL